MEPTKTDLNKKFIEVTKKMHSLNKNDTICSEEKEYRNLILQVEAKEIIFNLAVLNKQSSKLINFLKNDFLCTQSLLMEKEIELGIHKPIEGFTRQRKKPLYEIKVD